MKEPTQKNKTIEKDEVKTVKGINIKHHKKTDNNKAIVGDTL
jgi:hypothetical protein